MKCKSTNSTVDAAALLQDIEVRETPIHLGQGRYFRKVRERPDPKIYSGLDGTRNHLSSSSNLQSVRERGRKAISFLFLVIGDQPAPLSFPPPFPPGPPFLIARDIFDREKGKPLFRQASQCPVGNKKKYLRPAFLPRPSLSLLLFCLFCFFLFFFRESIAAINRGGRESRPPHYFTSLTPLFSDSVSIQKGPCFVSCNVC